MKRKAVEGINNFIAELDAPEDIDGLHSFFSREGQQLALRQAEKYLEMLRQHRPSTQEDAVAWDKLLVEYMDKVKRIKKAGERLDRLQFRSEAEKARAVEKLQILMRRVQEAPVVKE